MLKASVILSVHVQKMVPFLVEGECDPFGCMFRKWYHFLKGSEILLVHVQKKVPFLVEGQCDPFGACSENGTISC
jgi:hypothetical protein